MISHKHRCVFVHIPKTGGMSIENAFLKSLDLKFYKGQSPSLLLSYNKNPSVGPPSLAHLSAKDYVRHSYLSQELFESYFKFAFVRNPWERMVSIYKYFGYHRILKFERFLEVQFPVLKKKRNYFVKPQVEYIFDENGKQLIDFIGRFEQLRADFKEVQESLKHPVSELSHINRAPQAHNWYSRWNMKYIYRELKAHPHLINEVYLFNPVRQNYEEYYTPLAREIVHEYYKADFEILGYQ